MNTKVLLSVSGIMMIAAGIAGSFFPQESLVLAGVAPAGALPVVIQLLAALLFGFGMLNWTARGSLLGGIYNRPVGLGNFAHFVVGALAASKAAIKGENSLVIAVAVVYVVFAIGFALVFFTSPLKAEPREARSASRIEN